MKVALPGETGHLGDETKYRATTREEYADEEKTAHAGIEDLSGVADTEDGA